MNSIFDHILNVLFYALPLLLCFAVYSAFMMLLRWKTAARKKHAIRLGLSLLLMPVVGAMIYCVTFFVLVPDVMSDLVAENETRLRKRFDDTAIVKVGGQAPELKLRTFDGRIISVPDNGKITLLNFFATWCGPCLIELPHL